MAIFSVQSLTGKYRELIDDDQVTANDLERSSYNFQVTGFNVATAAMIAAVALTVFTNSLFIAAMGFLCYQARDAFANGLHYNRFELGEAVWNPIQIQLLDFVVWMNYAPKGGEGEGDAVHRAGPFGDRHRIFQFQPQARDEF